MKAAVRTINSLRDAFLRIYQVRKVEQMDRETLVRLGEMAGRRYVPFITRTQPTTNDDDVIALEAARILARWFERP